MRFIHFRLTNQTTTVPLEHIAKKFNDFMITGKVNAALRLLLEILSPGILPTNNDLPKEKHHDGAMKLDNLIPHGAEEFLGEYAHKKIDVTLIR